MAFCLPHFGISPTNKTVSEEGKEKEVANFCESPGNRVQLGEGGQERLKRNTEVMVMEWGR